MRFVFIGGTKFVGPVAARLAQAAGHEVVVAHTGEHEGPPDLLAKHLHGAREALLAEGGAVDLARPDVLVDTLAGGATYVKSAQSAACARRCGARLIAISSCDVYQYGIEAGLHMMAPVLLPSQPLPLDEDSPLRAVTFLGAEDHDNVAMERALRESEITATVLRPGAIYGKGDPLAREWPLVRRVKQGIKQLELPGGGVQFFHRVAVERVGRAIVAAAERAPAGFWACNVVDPYDWTYAGLAAEIGRILGWEWEPVNVSFAAARHPFQLASPFFVSDRRLREVLCITEPDPREALEAIVRWYWDHGPEPGALYADL